MNRLGSLYNAKTTPWYFFLNLRTNLSVGRKTVGRFLPKIGYERRPNYSSMSNLAFVQHAEMTHLTGVYPPSMGPIFPEYERVPELADMRCPAL